MDQNETAAAVTTIEDLPRRVVFSLLRPTLTDDEIHEGIRDALALGALCAVVRPSDLDAAVRQAEGTTLAPASTVAFPHGAATTAVKVYEARDLLRRGARELFLSVNLGKLISRQFQYIESEILQLARACHENGARLTVDLDSPHLANDLKIITLKICKRCEVDFVQTAADFELFSSILHGECQIQAAGEIAALDAALAVFTHGAARLVTPHAAALLDSWHARSLNHS